MEGWKQYVVSILGCCLCCGILSQILADPKRKELLRLISGTVLGICILQPLSGIEPESLLYSVRQNSSAAACIAEGEEKAEQIRYEYIKAACESYILDKAKALGAEIEIQITLNRQLIPDSSEIKGADGHVKTTLQKILTEDLGIPKEHQTWIWNQERSASLLP